MKQLTKKMFGLLLCLALIASLASGCGRTASTPSASETTPQKTAVTISQEESGASAATTAAPAPSVAVTADNGPREGALDAQAQNCAYVRSIAERGDGIEYRFAGAQPEKALEYTLSIEGDDGQTLNLSWVKAANDGSADQYFGHTAIRFAQIDPNAVFVRGSWEQLVKEELWDAEGGVIADYMLREESPVTVLRVFNLQQGWIATAFMDGASEANFPLLERYIRGIEVRETDEAFSSGVLDVSIGAPVG